MIKNAKVSVSAVKKFSQTVEGVKEYTPKFDKGIVCIEKFLDSLGEMEKSLDSDIESLQAAKKDLNVKIRDMEEKFAGLVARLNELETELSDLKNKLSGLDKHYTETDENGEEHKYPNPAYTAVEEQMSTVKGEMNRVEDEFNLLRQRLTRANSVQRKISLLLEEIKGVLYALAEKKNICKSLISRLEEVKKSNEKKSFYAFENLKKIEPIVAAYMRIKMVYDGANSPVNLTSIRGNNEININININQRSAQEETDTSSDRIENDSPDIGVADVEKHGIEFDSENHITKYDGKTFGGKYNSYEDRIDRTPKGNPILGLYEGLRGESKYIPSNRSVEGIAVIEILKKFDINGIEYRNGEPDFEVCAEAVVKVQNMTESRYNFIDGNGNTCLGNFSQADIELAKVWNLEEKEGRANWEPRDVFDYRKACGLTWHEKCDTETMVLVKTEINDFFRHLGGCSECRLRDAGNNEGGFDE